MNISNNTSFGNPRRDSINLGGGGNAKARAGGCATKEGTDDVFSGINKVGPNNPRIGNGAKTLVFARSDALPADERWSRGGETRAPGPLDLPDLETTCEVDAISTPPLGVSRVCVGFRSRDVRREPEGAGQG